MASAGSWLGNNWYDVANAALGAYGSYEQAKAANKGGTTRTDSTTTQTPYGSTLSHLDRILAEAENLYNQGPQRVGGRGGRGGGGGGGGGGAGGGVNSSQPSLDSSVALRDNAAGIFSEAAQRGFDMRDNEAARLATGGMAGILAGGGATGFEGYNPVLADLTGRLGGANFDRGTDILMNFLGENNRALAGTGAGSGSGAAGGSAAGSSGYPGTVGPRLTVRSPSVAGGVGGGGVVPDATGRGLFGTEVRKIFDEEANEEEIAAVIDSMRGDLERSKFSSMADLEARAAGVGRFGGDSHRSDIAAANARFAEELGQISAQLRYGDLTERRNARLAALNLLNNRDVAAMSDQTARAGINASAGASRYATDIGRELGLRGQDLDAIGMMLGHDASGLQLLAGLGGQLSGDQLAAIGMAPGIAGIELGGLEAALGGGSGIGNLYGIDQGTRASMYGSEQAASAARASTNLQRGIYNAESGQRALDNYLRTVLPIAAAGGTVTQQGTNVVPGQGYNTGAALAMGGLGGYLTSYGARQGQGAA